MGARDRVVLGRGGQKGEGREAMLPWEGKKGPIFARGDQVGEEEEKGEFVWENRVGEEGNQEVLQREGWKWVEEREAFSVWEVEKR